jgi:hypothetical protein
MEAIAQLAISQVQQKDKVSIDSVKDIELLLGILDFGF